MDGQTDQWTDQQSGLLSCLHATKNKLLPFFPMAKAASLATLNLMDFSQFWHISCPTIVISDTYGAWISGWWEPLQDRLKSFFSHDPQLYKSVCLSICPLVFRSVRWFIMLFSQRAETNQQTTYLVYTKLFINISNISIFCLFLGLLSQVSFWNVSLCICSSRHTILL